MSTLFAILDAALSGEALALAKEMTEQWRCLLRIRDIADSAPHLFVCPQSGGISTLILGSDKRPSTGVLVEAGCEFERLHRHLRSILVARRERDNQRIFLRYYDPRVLRALLPVLRQEDLPVFFGPITAFHCTAESPGKVHSFRLINGKLEQQVQSQNRFLLSFYKKPFDEALAMLSGGTIRT